MSLVLFQANRKTFKLRLGWEKNFLKLYLINSYLFTINKYSALIMNFLFVSVE